MKYNEMNRKQQRVAAAVAAGGCALCVCVLSIII